MKKLIAIASASVVAALSVGIAGAGVATASASGTGTEFRSCFGVGYGQSGLQYGQFKKDPAHPLPGGYGLPGVLAAHGPDGAAPLCST
jgi:hypothetical protein